jgi:hypothetical protein
MYMRALRVRGWGGSRSAWGSAHLLEERREVGAETGVPRGGEAMPEWGGRASPRAWLSANHQRSDGLRGPLSQGWGRGRWRDQAGGRLGQTPHHGVAVGDEERAHAVGARAGREQHATATDERMAGVGDLDGRRIVSRWVVDRGMKVFDRSPPSSTQPS